MEQLPDAGAPEAPRFPHHNVEASHELGLPDSPTIHLAITKMADKLMALASGSKLSAAMCRTQALRTASGAVLFRWSMEQAEWEFRFVTEQVDKPPPPKRTPGGPDWLGEARAEILAAGDDPEPDARRQATQYGWHPLGGDGEPIR